MSTSTPSADAGEAMPEPPDDIREAARLAPDHWLAMVDPTWSGDGPPPSWALIGQWRSGPTGEIEEWQDNDGYRPSPRARGWPEPADPVDAAVQLAVTGYGPAEDVPRVLAGAEVAVLVGSDGGPLTAAAPDLTPVLPVYTSQTYTDIAGRLAFRSLPVADLVELLPDGHHLYVNPSGPVSMLVETEPLLAALAAEAGDERGAE
jgi:hypothetical protein